MEKDEIEPYKTWEEWEREMLDGYDTSKRYQSKTPSAWLAIGHWLYQSKENGAYRECVTYHVCKTNWKRNYQNITPTAECGDTAAASSLANIERGCLLCGEKVPDGFKMIMLLEKL